MRTFQFERPNPQKPFVYQTPRGGMWWVRVYSLDGEYINDLFFTHADALAKAYELAAMNKEAAK